MTTLMLTAGVPPRDRLEQIGLWSLVGIVAAMQLSIAAAQILLTIAVAAWLVSHVSRAERLQAPTFFWPLLVYAALTLVSAGFSLDPEEKTATPYYIDVRYANKGSAAIDRGLVVSLEDGDGNTISSTTIINLGGEPFGKCPQAERGKLAPGQSYEDCRLFLVPGGREPERVTFLPYNPEEPTDFVRWTVP